MRYFLRSSLIALALLVSQGSAAKAEIWQWQDPISKVSVTVPDTWRMRHNQKPDDVVTFYAPGPGDFASCRVRVREDKRFVIYPVRYSGEIQRLNVSKDFWNGYLADYSDVVVNQGIDNVGLGRGFAGFVNASYTTAIGPKVAKRSIAFASIYGDKAYITECSAQASVFDKWYPTFMSVIKSVDFRKSIHEFPSGHYRDFINDSQVIIFGKREIDKDYYY